MLEYRGKYGFCKVMTFDIEEVAVAQIYDFLNCPASEGSVVRVMPDVHAGAGVTIGMTATVTNRVIPNMRDFTVHGKRVWCDDTMKRAVVKIRRGERKRHHVQ